jgi:hypothetical protein
MVTSIRVGMAFGAHSVLRAQNAFRGHLWVMGKREDTAKGKYKKPMREV